MTSAARTDFTRILDDLDARLLRAGRTARDQLAAAMALYLGDDPEVTGDAITSGDTAINQAWLGLEHDAVSAIARHQPVTRDLRQILAVLQSALHVERIGDTAVDVVESLQQGPGPAPAELVDRLRVMTRTVLEMVDVALDAFEDRDRDRIQELPGLDDRVDDQHAELLESLRDGGLPADQAVSVFHVSRLLERAGDHAVDIGEQVWFFVTGELVELDGRGPTHA